MRFETCIRCQKLNESINLKSVHYVGSCCIRIFGHYGQIKQTCPSDLAVVLSGRHNTHLVTLSSMSVAHYLLAFFKHPSVFSFALMHLRNFNICSLMCLSFSNISNGSRPHSLQINKHTHIATGTYNNFMCNSLLKYCHKFLFYASYKTLTVDGKQIQYSALSRSSYF